MQLGCVTYNVLKDWDLETCIVKLEEAGFAAVELRTEHKHGVEPSLDSAARKRVAERFARSKVKLLSYGTTCEFHAADPAVRRKNIDIAKTWIDLAHDTNAWGIKVRPNGFPKDVPPRQTIDNIAACLNELGDVGRGKGVEIWVEVHGAITQIPSNMAAIMRATKNDNVGLCWNSNPTDVEDVGIAKNFALLRPWIKNVHINELSSDYPWRELFALLRKSNYDRYTLCECAASPEPERFLRWYKALWTELNRA